VKEALEYNNFKSMYSLSCDIINYSEAVVQEKSVCVCV